MIDRSLLARALQMAGEGYSADRVVVDPELNAQFVAACRKLGLVAPIEELNLALLNLRKSGGCEVPTTQRTSFRSEGEYRFASEVAIRLIERRDQISIDRILCDPGRVAEFDVISSGIAPGFAPVQYRWAALNLRKLRRLSPELLARVRPAVEVHTARVDALSLNAVPRTQGLYFFFNSTAALYVGEAQNLRKRIEKHLDHSDNKGLAQWLWAAGTADLHLEWHSLETDTATRVRKALEAELIASRQPLFNVQCVSPRDRPGSGQEV
jgi:site-specific DNA-methyltransferase (adenine-specific)